MTNREGRFVGWTESIAVEDGESEVIAIPTLDRNKISVTAIPGANTALVKFTTSSDAAVAADTATWQEWIYGSVTSTTNGVVMSPITGLKFEATGGTCNFEVVY